MRAGTPVTLRLRTFHDDVTGVTVRVCDTAVAGTQFVHDVALAAATSTATTPPLGGPTVRLLAGHPAHQMPARVWYRFIVTDGTVDRYYADDTPALDGGLGATTATAATAAAR